MKKAFLFIFISSIFIGCSSDSTNDVTSPPPAKITYKANVKSIIDQSCATSGCHNAASSASGLTLETYTQVKNAFTTKNALGRMENTGNPMPPQSKGGNLPSTTITIIKNWKTQGYLEQ